MTTDVPVGRSASGGAAVRFVSPFIYVLALIPAVAVTAALGSVLAGIFGRGSVWYLLLVVAGLIVGAAVYGGLGRFVISAEGPHRSRLADHFRRCALLYTLLVVTLVWSVTSYLATDGIGWPTFATEMQLHLLSVILAALAVDRIIASSIARNFTGGNS